MSYYIKGNKERGAEVIALLESKGGKNLRDLVGDDPDFYYFIDKNDEIDCCTNTPYSTCILNAFCEELTLPEEWKPKYKIAAEVQTVNTHQKGTIIFIDSTDKSYQVSFANSTQFWFKENEIEPYKWTPKRGETILVKAGASCEWEEAVYSYSTEHSYHTVGGESWNKIYCIPFDESKLGKITEG